MAAKLDRRDPRRVLNKGGWHPQCFRNARQYNQWMLLLQISGERRSVGYCIDCTPEHKMEMMLEGRCEHPETQFIVRRNSEDADQLEMIGVSSKSVYWARVEAGSTIIDLAYDDKD